MKKLKYYILGLGGAILMTACSDFLDSKNLSNPEDADIYFKEHPEQIRPVAYNAVRWIATHIDMLDQATDLYINPRGNDDGQFALFTITPDNGTVKEYYQKVMFQINRANCMIHYAGESGDKLVEAEGRFLRVFGYYYMTQQFGSIPYVTEYIQTAENDIPKTPLDEIYKALLDECEDLYNNSTLPNQDHNGAASKQAVAAIAAKIALAAAWDLDTTLENAEAGTYTVNSKDMFKKAAEWAEKSIMGIQLTMSFVDKWAWNNEGNAEEIFSAQYDRKGYPGNKASGGHSLMYNYMSYYGNCIVTGQKGTKSGGTNAMSAKAASLFEKGDTRFEGTFMTVFYNAPLLENKNATWGTQGYLARYNCTEEEQKALPIAMKFYPSYTTEAEAEADIRKLVENGQAKQFKENTYGVNLPFAAIISGENVIKWEFNTAGTMPSKKTVPFTTFIVESANNGTCVCKYDDPESDNVTEKNDYRDVPLLHVSEMYLVAAEAYLMAGDEVKALEKINDVRARAGAPRLSSFGAYIPPYITNANFNITPLDLVLDERARECYAERTRYFDLRRTKQLVRYNLEFSRYATSVATMKNAKGEIKWYRPIPQAEIDANHGITSADQNPGY